LGVSAMMEAAPGPDLPHATTTKVILYRDLPCIDLEVTLHEKPADPWPEAGWICLPLKVDAPRFRLARLGSIIDPASDIVPGANRHLLALNSGLSIIGSDGGGVGLCALDSPLVSLEAPGCWKYSTNFVPSKPSIYVNLFNNQWTTNFRLWNSGTWTSRIRLWAFPAYDPESALITPSLEARWPLQAAISNGPAGALPTAQPGLELARRGLLVTAFGPNPDGPGLMMRLWEHAGQSGECQVQLPSSLKIKAVQPVDLRGRPSGEALHGHHFTIPVKAFAPTTLRIDG
jgi:alpha-mannosidase